MVDVHGGHDGLFVADVHGDLVGRIRVDGHGDQVESDAAAVERAAFETFGGHGYLGIVGAEWDAWVFVGPILALVVGPISPAL